MTTEVENEAPAATNPAVLPMIVQTNGSEQPAPAEELQSLTSESDGFVPRGTLLFVLLMLLGYALYWAYLWIIVVLERGIGGAI